MRRIASGAALVLGIAFGILAPRVSAQETSTTCAYETVDYVAGYLADSRTEAIIEFGPSQAEPSDILADTPTVAIHEDIIVETYAVDDDTYFLQTTSDGGWIMYSAIECHTLDVPS
jgi:hypothetical protein